MTTDEAANNIPHLHNCIKVGAQFPRKSQEWKILRQMNILCRFTKTAHYQWTWPRFCCFEHISVRRCIPGQWSNPSRSSQSDFSSPANKIVVSMPGSH